MLPSGWSETSLSVGLYRHAEDVAQPGGADPTEFVLTELTGTRAVFDNPSHDYPKRIVYELSAADGLSATIGFTEGGSPRRFEFEREGG